MSSFNQFELKQVVGLCSGIMLLLSHKGNEINVNRLQREKESERDRKEREEESDLGYNAMKSIMLYKNHKFFLNQLIGFFQ